jgi:enamine deaminase RidA (YjgF/YER057c/UK114 family)
VCICCQHSLCSSQRAPRLTGSLAALPVSGTGTGSGADGKPRVGTAAEETRWALENLKQILEDAGSNLERVVQVFCLVQDKKCALLRSHLSHQPASSAGTADPLAACCAATAWRRDYAEINAEYVKHWSLLPARSTTHGAPTPPLCIHPSCLPQPEWHWLSDPDC